MTDLEKWSCDANEAIKISLISGANDKPTTFSPAFTYAIFGKEDEEEAAGQQDEEAKDDGETIFGYQGLKIRLDFKADTMRPDLRVTYAEKINPTGDIQADEPEEILREFMPALEDSDVTEEHEPAFTPPGKKIQEYRIGDRSYGIWVANLSDPAAKQLLRNMQILVLLFIEGASIILLDDVDWTIQRWTVFFVYEIIPPSSSASSSSYSFIGYSTAYRLFFLDIDSESTSPSSPLPSLFPADDPNLLDALPCRERISQFLILPPYQSSGHGSKLYNTMISHFLSHPQIRTITVEDPNEHFDDLRDFNDLIRLRQSNPEFVILKLNITTTLPTSKSQPLPTSSLLPQETISTIAQTTRIADRQLARLVEMQLLSAIPPHHRNLARTTRKDKASDPNDRAYYFWRLVVKQRLYKHNMDQLVQLEVEERVEKLEQALGGVELDYLRILEEVGRRMGKMDKEEVVVKVEKEKEVGSGKGKKRRIVEEDEEEDGGEEVKQKSVGKVKKRVKSEIVELD